MGRRPGRTGVHDPLAWDLVIFDCDGVLVDSERIGVRIDVRVLAELGSPLTEAEVIERFVGRSEAYMVSEIEAAIGRHLPLDWDDAFRSLYREAFEAELEALDAIAAPTCVASSSSHERLRHTLALTGLLGRFEGRIFSAEDERRRHARLRLRRRPHPRRPPGRPRHRRVRRHARPAGPPRSVVSRRPAAV